MDGFCPTSEVARLTCMQNRNEAVENHLRELFRIFVWWEIVAFSLRMPRFSTGFLCSLFFGLNTEEHIV